MYIYKNTINRHKKNEKKKISQHSVMIVKSNRLRTAGSAGSVAG